MELTCDRRETGSVTGWRYPWLENNRHERPSGYRLPIQPLRPKHAKSFTNYPLPEIPFHRGTTHPLIGHPSIISRTFQHPTWLPIHRYGLPLAFVEGTIPKTCYKTNSASHPPLTRNLCLFGEATIHL